MEQEAFDAETERLVQRVRDHRAGRGITAEEPFERGGWRRIVAKYPGTCLACGSPIKIGRRIRWNQGRGVLHDRCRLVGET